MKQLNLAEFKAAINAEVLNQQQLLITEVAIDSRKLSGGEVFFALEGENFDGHDFINQAVKKGVKAVVVDNKAKLPAELNLPVFLVEDTLTALQDLAKFNCENSNVSVVAITGSTGKTTTKDFIASLLEQRYNVLKTAGNYNNEIGLPLTLLKLDETYDLAVVEMGMRGLGEIDFLAQLAKPEVGVITNVGTVHLELLKTRDNIARAKAELVENLPASGLAVLNADDQRVIKMKDLTQADYISYGVKQAANVSASQIKAVATKVEFKAEMPDAKTFSITLPIQGSYNVYNALAALAVADRFDLNLSEIKAGFKNLQLSQMRNQLINTKAGFKLINDVYNANPTSMKAALDTLSELEANSRIAILGDMFELGHLAKEQHYKLGEYISKQKIDYLITIGELAENIVKGAVENGFIKANTFSFVEKEAVIDKALELVNADDIILVKGSRGMKLEEVVERIIN